MAGLYQVAVHKESGESGHSKEGRMVVLALPCKGDPDPVDNWLAINLSSCVNDGVS